MLSNVTQCRAEKSRIKKKCKYRIFRTVSHGFFHSLVGGAPYILELLMCEIISTLLPVYHFTCYLTCLFLLLDFMK